MIADGIVSTSGYTPASPFTLKVYNKGKETASSMTFSSVLIYHGSTDAPTVDFVETGYGAGTVLDDFSYGEFHDYIDATVRDYAVDIKDSSTNDVLATYNTPLKSLNLADQSITVLVSGFLDPQQNNGGPALGLFYVTAAGGDLMAFPLAPLSVSKSTFNSLTVYPNPVSEHIMLKGFSLENLSFDIVDMQERKLNNTSYKLSGSNRLDVSNLSTGMYHLIITDAQKNSNVKKFIKN